MQVKSIPSRWIYKEGLRLDSNPYMSGVLEAKMLLDRLSVPKVKLQDLTFKGMEGIFHAGREGRTWVDNPQYGTPFMNGRDILASDLSYLPLLSNKQIKSNPKLLIEDQWILITRSGTIGRMSFSRAEMGGLACTEDVLRVVPDKNLVHPGYLYAYLISQFGIPLVTSGTYGAIIQHIEPHHVSDISIPRFSKELEAKVHELILKTSRLRTKYQSLLNLASETFLQEIGLSDIDAVNWESRGRDLGFSTKLDSQSLSLRAFNYSPRIRAIVTHLASQKHKTLGDICSNGLLSTGKRFKRVDCEPEFGVRLVGQKQGFWLRPEGRWISPNFAPDDIRAEEETILIASSGTLGEREVYCRAILVAGKWKDYAYTQHFLRILPGDLHVSGAYLFAFFRTNIAFKILRSMSTGSKQQEIHRSLIARLPIPMLPDQKKREIEENIRKAFSYRDEADELEDQAVALVEKAIKEAA